MVFVVNDLTWFEQKYVAMLHQKYVQCKQHKDPTCRYGIRLHGLILCTSTLQV